MFQYRQALVRMRRGDSDRDIARSKSMGRRKLAALRALAERAGWLDANRPLPDEALLHEALGRSQRAASTISTVEAHRARIARWLDEGVSAVAIHAALKREHNFRGSYSAVYRMVRDIEAQRPPQSTVRLSFAPGEAAQVDFGAGPMLMDPARPSGPQRTWCFVMTLCYSRHQYVEFVWDQSVATWQGCHRRAFEWFYGVPLRVIVDNAKCAITRACVYDPDVQRSYYECAEAYGFKVDACPPGDPQKKGIVESGVKYVKRNFLALRQFRDLEDLNAQAQRWVTHEAGRRVHGSTRRMPLSDFKIEQMHLRALPIPAPALGEWHQVRVHRDCHVAHARSFYSVPFALVGQTLWLRRTDTSVMLYDDQHRMVALHARARELGTRRTLVDHLPPHAQLYFAHDRSWCMRQARAIGPDCAQFIDALLGDRVQERLRAAQGVLRLERGYGSVRLEAACTRALHHASVNYRSIKSILRLSLDQQPLERDPAQSLVAHVPQARFARNARSLFAPHTLAPDQDAMHVSLSSPASASSSSSTSLLATSSSSSLSDEVS